MSNGDPTMSAPGAAGRVLSNSPFAYAIPTCREPLLALDIAFSAVAGVKIHQAAREHRLVPEGWIVDKNGLPTTNPKDFENGGAHIPIGGHKGFGLALMVEILAGVITGSGITKEVTSFVQYPMNPSNVGHFFMALNVASLMSMDEFKSRVDRLATEIKTFPRREDTERIYVPGEMEFGEEEKARTHGVLLDKTTRNSLRALAHDLGLNDVYEGIFVV
jgi:ureidoglycolate dehydrogenase (NAD+)